MNSRKVSRLGERHPAERPDAAGSQPLSAEVVSQGQWTRSRRQDLCLARCLAEARRIRQARQGHAGWIRQARPSGREENPDELKAQVTVLGKNCKACHDDYRSPDYEKDAEQ